MNETTKTDAPLKVALMPEDEMHLFKVELMKVEARLVRVELLLTELRELLVWKDKRTGKTKLTPIGSTLRRGQKN